MDFELLEEVVFEDLPFEDFVFFEESPDFFAVEAVLFFLLETVDVFEPVVEELPLTVFEVFVFPEILVAPELSPSFADPLLSAAATVSAVFPLSLLSAFPAGCEHEHDAISDAITTPAPIK